MKIDFHYSTIYDAMLSEMSNKEQDIFQVREVQKFMKDFETSWKKIEKKVITNIEKHSKLKFKENLTLYFVKHMRFAALSIPLTLKLTKNKKLAEKILIHEIIHNLLSQNEKKLKPLIANIYPEEDWEFRIHMPVMLIQKKVFNSIYGKKDTEAFIRQDRKIFGPEWNEISRIEKRYKGDIVSFLKYEDLE